MRRALCKKALGPTKSRFSFHSAPRQWIECRAAGLLFHAQESSYRAIKQLRAWPGSTVNFEPKKCSPRRSRACASRAKWATPISGRHAELFPLSSPALCYKNGHRTRLARERRLSSRYRARHHRKTSTAKSRQQQQRSYEGIEY